MNKVTMWLNLAFLLWIFRVWFLGGVISAGDIHYIYGEGLREYLVIPQAWAGEFRPPFLFSYPQQLLSGFFASLGFSFAVVERLVWFWPAIGISWVSSVILFRRVFPENRFWVLAPLVYTTNTYFLMVAGGGQMGVALGYALAPLTIWAWGRQWSLKSSLIAGIVTAVQIAGDLRVTYVTVLMVLIFELWKIVFTSAKIKELVRFTSGALISMCVVMLLHAYWVLPLILSGRSPTQDLTAAYTSSKAVEFFSFADLSHTFSLLHPNWPENIFGKVRFFRWEFLGLPILASFSLWGVVRLIGNTNKLGKEEVRGAQKVLSWYTVLMIGAILAAGANSPIGGVYVWLFENVPGFVMFRDPTKFYLLVALSYSLLIPIALENLISIVSFYWSPRLQLRSQAGRLSFGFVSVVFIGYWMILLAPAWNGEVKGTLVATQVPVEYERWADSISRETEFSRTLWLPEKQRFAYVSQNHPFLDGQVGSKESSVSGIVDWLNQPDRLNWLRRRSVKYVIVPIDTHGEIFLTDRKYDESKRQELIAWLNKMPWLVRLTGHEPLEVYQIANVYPRVWLENEAGEMEKINFVFKSPSELLVNLREEDKGKQLVVNENFDVGWRYNVNGTEGSVDKINDDLLKIKIDRAGNMKVYYQPQQVMNVGIGISIMSLMLLPWLVRIMKR